jgi:quinol monooxygenase YgiN
MRSLFSALFGVLLLLAVAAPSKAGEAPDPNQGPIYVTTYFEVAPANTRAAMAALKDYRDAARKEQGVMSSGLLQEVGAASRFVINEEWQNWAAYDAHLKAGARTQLNAKMAPIQYGPPDARAHLAHYMAPQKGASGGAGQIVIVSHLDVTPNQIPALLEAMKPLSEGSANDAGMVTYQILRQAPGVGNHFRLYEVWTNERDWAAHNAAKHTQDFRNALYPMLGTPYDQRRYTIVN